MSPKSLCIVAGEPSGDLHGSLLVSELKSRHPDWRIWGVGSDRMAAAGCELWQDAHSWAVMGFAEVFKSLWQFRERLRALERQIAKRRPDGVILIDFPGFNLKLAAHVHRLRIPVLYYIVPQLWAWGRGRIKLFERYVDRTIVVFPFEQAFFAEHGLNVDWVGHPFVDYVHPSAGRAALRQRLGIRPEERLVALMPGVRVQDYNAHLPLFTEVLKRVAESVPGVRGAIGVSRSLSDGLLRVDVPQLAVGIAPSIPRQAVGYLAMTPDVYDLMTAADLVITKTGTTTVECAILGTPMVTAYRTGTVNYIIAKALVDIPFIAMPNLIAKRHIVPEFVQSEATPEALSDAAITLLTDDAMRRGQVEGLGEVRKALGPPGAVARAAGLVERWLEQDQE